MVMAGHDDKRQQSITLVGEVQEGVLNDGGLPLILQVTHRRLAVKQLIDEAEQQLMFMVFQLRLGHAVGAWTAFEFFAVLVDPRQPGSR